MSKLVFLLKHSRKIDLFCSLVKGIIKPRPPGEVAAIADGEGCGRTQFIPSVLLAPHPVGGDLWSPALQRGWNCPRPTI